MGYHSALSQGSLFRSQRPVFQQEISFYVFTVPVMEFAANWLFSVIVFSMLGTLATYALSQTLSFFPGKSASIPT
jgi:uncharacterized membrane protein (UPF0182 family)